jgi:hypothetical protein
MSYALTVVAFGLPLPTWLLLSLPDLNVIVVLGVFAGVRLPHLYSCRPVNGLIEPIGDNGEPFHQRC